MVLIYYGVEKVISMQELYQGQILDLAKSARQSKSISKPTHWGEKNNPVCGDKVTITVVVDKTVISDVHFVVRGCALCEAGAGLLGKTVIGKNIDDLDKLKDDMSDYLLRNQPAPDNTSLCFDPVKKIKNRITCVLLAFEAASQLIPAENTSR